MAMSAEEVLKWLAENYITEDKVYKKVFGEDYCFSLLFDSLSPQEIVEHIEKYESEKNDPIDACNKAERNFKVGDWVTPCHCDLPRQVVEVIGCNQVRVRAKNGQTHTWETRNIKHTEPPMRSATQEELEGVDAYIKSISKPVGDDVENFFSEARSMGEPAIERVINRNGELFKKTITTGDGVNTPLVTVKIEKYLAPEEEEKKIEPYNDEKYISYKIVDKINELVDAVNELRGVN